MGLDNLPGLGKAQPCALVSLGAKEVLKEEGQVLLGYATACIGNLDLYGRIGSRTPYGQPTPRPPRPPRPLKKH